MSSPALAHRRQLQHLTCGTVTKPEASFPIFSTLTQIPINVFFHHALNKSIIGLLFVCSLCAFRGRNKSGFSVCGNDRKNLLLFLTLTVMFSLPLTVVIETDAPCSLAESSRCRGVHEREKSIACPDLVHIHVQTLKNLHTELKTKCETGFSTHSIVHFIGTMPFCGSMKIQS